ncbi:hypothetical protein V500_00494 [Pseudogymnoascus sp. VKM F-4518 (FW-2643)]|nr:hypothetical protein V500_00494 [Pseudogymnoascus sp. VKM F-4518 (FW-2643)]
MNASAPIYQTYSIAIASWGVDQKKILAGLADVTGTHAKGGANFRKMINYLDGADLNEAFFKDDGIELDDPDPPYSSHGEIEGKGKLDEIKSFRDRLDECHIEIARFRQSDMEGGTNGKKGASKDIKKQWPNAKVVVDKIPWEHSSEFELFAVNTKETVAQSPSVTLRALHRDKSSTLCDGKRSAVFSVVDGVRGTAKEVILDTDAQGQQERFELAEAHCGFVPLVILTCSFPSWSAAAIHASISQNASQLLKSYPLLSAGIADRLRRKPRWQLRDATLDVNSVVHLEAPRALTPEDIMNEEEVKGALFDFDRGPLWRIGIYSAPGSVGCFVALTLSHVLMDGSGALEFLRLLLQEPTLNSDGGRAVTSLLQAEETMSMRPTIIEAASAVGQEILVNFLPRNLQGLIRKAPFWPTVDMLVKNPVECKPQRSRLHFGSSRHSIVSGLKNFGKMSGAGSIQSLIHTACLIALLSATAETQSCRLPSVTINTETPIALRDAELGHPPLLGNYTALADFSATFDEIKTQTVFYVTSKYDSYIHSTAGKEAVKRRSGMLGLIPDLPYFSTPSFAFEGSRVTPCPTGFETFLTQQGESPLPYRGSLAVSNLGLLKLNQLPQATDRNLQDVWFAQSPMPWGVALYVDVVGYSAQSPDVHGAHNELGIVVSWLDGAIDAGVAEKFGRVLSRTIESIAKSGNAGLEAVELLKNRRLGDLAAHSISNV